MRNRVQVRAINHLEEEIKQFKEDIKRLQFLANIPPVFCVDEKDITKLKKIIDKKEKVIKYIEDYLSKEK
jgi:hypothetical protein